MNLLKTLKLLNKYGFVFCFSCLFFPLKGQVPVLISGNDSLTTLLFQQNFSDTSLYFFVPDKIENYTLIYQHPTDTQYVHAEQQTFRFRDCEGLKIRFWGNGTSQNVCINLQHDFSSQSRQLSPQFIPSYQTLFCNFQEIEQDTKATTSMMIVCNELFSSGLSEFIQQKNKEGIQTYLLTLTPTDSIDSIQAMIHKTYTLFHPDYLLLIGDDALIPAYRLADGLSDERFACIEGEDDFPEMIVGRLSVNTLEELNLQLDKLEKRNNTVFSKRALGIASNNYSENTGIYDWEYLRETRSVLTEKQFFPVYEMYDSSQGEEDKAGNPSEEDILTIINSGVSLINYAGYGSYEEWETGNFTHSSIDKLTNTFEFPLVISAACLNGYFAGRECLAEKWMHASSNDLPSGAVACLMFSSLIDWDAAILALQTFNRFLPATDTNASIGSVYLQTYIQMITQLQRSKDMLSWILFGDPSMTVYPDKTTSIPVPAPEMNVIVYPNPVVNQCTITSDKQLRSIQLFSLTGQKLLDKTLQTQTTTLDISNLNTGIYFIKITIEDGSSITKKIIKQ